MAPADPTADLHRCSSTKLLPRVANPCQVTRHRAQWSRIVAKADSLKQVQEQWGNLLEPFAQGAPSLSTTPTQWLEPHAEETIRESIAIDGNKLTLSINGQCLWSGTIK